MKPYGIPRIFNKVYEDTDKAKLKYFAMKPENNGTEVDRDVRSNFKRVADKRRIRRFWKRKERHIGKELCKNTA